MDGRTTRWKRIAAEAAPFVLLWAAYFAFGLWLRGQIPIDLERGELHGFDYNAHGRLFSDYRLILFTRFRHPLFGWLMSPIPLLLQPVARISFVAFWACLSAIFSAIVTACVWLVFRIAARIEGVGRIRAAVCAGAFASFGYMRYLAAGPESFAVSMLLALVVLWWGLHSPFAQDGFAPGFRRKLDRSAWGVLFFLSGGITITQGVKTAVAYVVSRKMTKRTWFAICGGAAALALAGALFYVVKLVLLGGGGRTIGGGVEELLASIPHGLSWAQRLRMLEMFFCEPLIPHGAPYSASKLTAGYASWWQYAACAAIYALAAVGAWRGRRTLLVRIIAATFAVDAAIHFAFFWGMQEAQIYCGHWFYALPLLIAQAIARRQRSDVQRHVHDAGDADFVRPS